MKPIIVETGKNCEVPYQDKNSIDLSTAGAVSATRDTLQERYNTATAQLIGSHRSDFPSDSCYYYEESLYKQDTGAFFLVGEGGPLSGYGRMYPDGSTGYGKGGFSISLLEALAWITKYCSEAALS